LNGVSLYDSLSAGGWNPIVSARKGMVTPLPKPRRMYRTLPRCGAKR
jgi:hypothetical protein